MCCAKPVHLQASTKKLHTEVTHPNLAETAKLERTEENKCAVYPFKTYSLAKTLLQAKATNAQEKGRTAIIVAAQTCPLTC